MLAEFRDCLKTLDVADNYYIGKIDNSKLKTIGVYGHQGGLARVEAIGKESSYNVTRIRILIHWNKNAKETETASWNVYELLRYITDVDMGTVHVQYLSLDESEPAFIGTDDNGVYEYHISARIYYRR